MESISLGKTPRRISRLGLGGCPLGGHGWGTCRDEDATRAVRAAVERGVTFFDTADVYGFGHSEKLLAEALSSDRTSVTLASKFGVRWDRAGNITKDISPTYAREALEQTLLRLNVDHLPLYYIHWPDGKTPIEEAVSQLDTFRREGKIGAIGLSNFSADEVRRAAQVATIDAVQVEFSLIEREIAARLFEVAKKFGITLVTWGSLAQGLLTGKYGADISFPPEDRRSRYPNFQGEKFLANLEIVARVKSVAERIGRTPAEVAIRWLLDTAEVGSVLFGAKSPQQVEENLGADRWSLTAEEGHFLSHGEMIHPGPNRTKEPTK